MSTSSSMCTKPANHKDSVSGSIQASQAVLPEFSSSFTRPLRMLTALETAQIKLTWLTPAAQGIHCWLPVLRHEVSFAETTLDQTFGPHTAPFIPKIFPTIKTTCWSTHPSFLLHAKSLQMAFLSTQCFSTWQRNRMQPGKDISLVGSHMGIGVTLPWVR